MTSLAADLLGRREAGEQDRLPDRVAQRRDPQVVLELGQRLGEGLGHRTRAVHRTDGDATDLGGDRTGLQEPEVPVDPDRPLDVLRTAEDPLDVPGQRDEAAEQRRPAAAGRRHG